MGSSAISRVSTRDMWWRKIYHPLLGGRHAVVVGVVVRALVNMVLQGRSTVGKELSGILADDRNFVVLSFPARLN
jgi:hypothetical protein